MTLTARSYVGEMDLQPIADLLNACEAADREDVYYSVAELRMEATAPDCDPVSDWRLWQDANGRLVAFGKLWLPSQSIDEADGFLWFRVHPLSRQRGLEPEILAWGEARIQEVAQTRCLPAKLAVSCRASQADRISLFQTHGFTYDRSFLRMQRSLTVSLPTPQLSDGFTLKTGHDTNTAAWVDMYNQTFIDHWNFHPTTIEQVNHQRSDPHYQPELDLVAVAPDGTYAAFCYAHIDADENQQRGCREGWISILGTRRGFRRMGLGRAMLLSGLHRLKAAGMETALLGVDSQNPNQAYDLYESVGFRKLYTNLVYAKRFQGSYQGS